MISIKVLIDFKTFSEAACSSLVFQIHDGQLWRRETEGREWGSQGTDCRIAKESRRRQEGRRILECVPQYSIESGEDKPVTAARKFIHAEGIAPPALLLVKRNEHTTDRYFWAEKGLFGAQYVEENHFLFPSLKVMLEATAEKIPVVSASRA